MMSEAFFIICMAVGVCGTFMGIQGVRASWNRKLEISYRVSYCVICTFYIFLALFTSKSIGGYNAIEGSILAAFLIANYLMIIFVVLPYSAKKRRIGFKQILFYGMANKKRLEYQKLEAKKFAEKNRIAYISNAKGGEIVCSQTIRKIIAKKNKYILLHPANDGISTVPIEWYGEFFRKSESNTATYYALIFDNQKSFNCITNLSEIIINMIELYESNIDADVFIDSSGFAIRLADEPTEGYEGRADLVITEAAIRNADIELDEKMEAKKYFINEFLDHFLGWNFGVVIKENANLEERLNQFNELVISKGIRKDAGPGANLWKNDFVQPYDLKIR